MRTASMRTFFAERRSGGKERKSGSGSDSGVGRPAGAGPEPK